MHPLIADLTRGVVFTGNIWSDVTTFLVHHQCAETAGHSARVVSEARWLARKFGVHLPSAEMAAWLHDVSAVFPVHERLTAAIDLGLDVLPEEVLAPMIIHQKLSVVIAQEVFEIHDPDILSAIGCHTTLKADASPLDKVVFLADKIRWDRPTPPPYQDAMLAAAERSLDRAVFCYLDYLWQRRDTLPVVHPWLVDAYHQLSEGDA